ncbi:MAG: retention module-containing protein, partial [Marinomonas sp.]|uniref:retention module-containing protein n=2 Tax=Marinomonas sp. TaxID=1904862 RepID=UPI003C736D01
MSDSQTSFATLGSPIGTIIQITGSVVVKSIDGNERVVQVGDPIFYGETVETGSGASATIKFIDGSEVVIGGDSIVVINDEVYTPDDIDGLAQDSSSDTEALQQAIADGADPTLIQDAPAAGEETIAEQQRVDVDVARNQDGSLPNFGFDTGLSSLPSYGYDTNNSFSTLSSTTQTSSSSSRTADNTADIDNNLTVSVSASDQTTNASEASSVSVTLSGVDSDASQVSVVFSDGSSSVTANATQNGAGNWVVADTDISSLNDGTVSVTTTVTDGTGNTATATDTLDLDTTADAGVVTIDDISGDDIIDVTESKSTIAVNGTALGGDIAEGDIVTMTINDNTYTTTVGSDGTWAVDVAGADLTADQEFDVVVTSSDAAGNTVESVGTSSHTLDQAALLINLDIDQVTNDGVLNGVEVSETVSVTGSVTGDDFDSGVVTLLINDVTYTTTVGSDGIWSVDVIGSDLQADADKQIEGSVTVSNSIGQQGEADTTETYLVDTSARASISVNSITSDDVLNTEESSSTVTVSGRVGFDAAAGDVVSMTINGQDYSAVVLANKTWSVDVDGSDLAEDASFTVTVTGEDGAGNPFIGSTTSTHTVDTSASAPAISLEAADANDDGVYNAEELGTDGTVLATISLPDDFNATT